MRAVLFDLFGVPIQSYGVSKLLAALVAAWLLGRAFTRRGWAKDDAHQLVLWATVWGFVGAKVYFLAEHPGEVGMHQLASGFTWYGGFLAGAAAAVVIIRRHRLPLGAVAGMAAVPLAVAYGIGRLGCLLAGDGSYGRPSGLPWAMAFPNGAVPIDVAVQPTPLYEALVAFALAGLLWWLGRRAVPVVVFAAYLVGSGAARFAVEWLRVNRPVLGRADRAAAVVGGRGCRGGGPDRRARTTAHVPSSDEVSITAGPTPTPPVIGEWIVPGERDPSHGSANRQPVWLVGRRSMEGLAIPVSAR